MPKNRKSAEAFTLVELLISVGLLALLCLLVMGIISSTSTATVASSKHVDADTQARLVFNRMANDFRKMVIRSDVDYVFTKQAGNDALHFYTEAPAYFDSGIGSSARNSVALVGYRINSDTTSTTYGQLERLGKGLTWDGSSSWTSGHAAGGSVLFLTYASGSSTPLAGSLISNNWKDSGGVSVVSGNSKDSDYHVLGDQTYRLEFSFLLNDGSLSVTPPASGSGVQNVSAIIVALGVLDNTSRTIVPKSTSNPTVIDSTVMSRMINALPDSAPGQAITQTWSNSTYLTTSGIPPAAASQIRIYQRYFYINVR
jgi:type II secretory pathway component PulJ